jgi:hypothetical protein
MALIHLLRPLPRDVHRLNGIRLREQHFACSTTFPGLTLCFFASPSATGFPSSTSK